MPSVRTWIKQHPNWGLGIVLFCALITCGSLLWQLARPSLTSGVVDGTYYYDLSTGKLFASPAAQLLPIPSPGASGKTPDNETTGGVLAAVYGCGGCEPDQLVIGYIMTHNPDIVAQARSHSNDIIMSLLILGESSQGVWIKAYNNAQRKPLGQWIPMKSEAGKAIVDQIARQSPCGDGMPAIQCGVP